jgi:hypothetical protein
MAYTRRTRKQLLDLTVNTANGLHGADIYTRRDAGSLTVQAELDTKMALVAAADEGNLAIFDAAGQVVDGGAVPTAAVYANYAHKVTAGEITAKKIVFSGAKPSDAANFLAVYINGALEATVDYALTTGASAEFDWDGKGLEEVIAAGDLIGFSFKA